MANIEITNSKTTGIVVWDPVFENGIINESPGIVYLAGTILGRKSGSGDLTAYALGNSDGSQVPVAVLQEDLIILDIDSIFCRPIIAGRVRRVDLVVHGIGTGITDVESDALCDYGIIPLNTTQFTELDNE